MSPFFIPYSITNMGSALVAMEEGFMGPNFSVSTACATSNYAFHMAALLLRNGDCDVVLTGSYDYANNLEKKKGQVYCYNLGHKYNVHTVTPTIYVLFCS